MENQSQATPLPNEENPSTGPRPEHGGMMKFLTQVFLGPNGLRAGWTIFLFLVFSAIFAFALGALFSALHLVGKARSFTAVSMIFGLLTSVLPIAASAWILAKINRHRFDAYNLAGPSRVRRFLFGLLSGFAAVSSMIGILYAGGFLHFGPVALSGMEIFKYAALWGIGFILVGFNEEGMFRCFLQFVFTRALNFFTAILAFVVFYLLFATIISLTTLVKMHSMAAVGNALHQWAFGDPMIGVYLLFGLGFIPSLMLHLRKSASPGFWYAAWIGSTLFGMVHTGNGGENWIGIFSAGAIGYIFCVSVYLTGSVWWAIGFHAAWDWGLTYFYGAADSGNPAAGHFLSVNPVGNAILSGGADGPEGSILIIPLLIVLLLLLNWIYKGQQPASGTAPAA